MQLKEKKSSMERDKRKLESELEKQRQTIGKQVFLQVVQKKNLGDVEAPSPQPANPPAPAATATFDTGETAPRRQWDKSQKGFIDLENDNSNKPLAEPVTNAKTASSVSSLSTPSSSTSHSPPNQRVNSVAASNGNEPRSLDLSKAYYSRDEMMKTIETLKTSTIALASSQSQRPSSSSVVKDIDTELQKANSKLSELQNEITRLTVLQQQQQTIHTQKSFSKAAKPAYLNTFNLNEEKSKQESQQPLQQQQQQQVDTPDTETAPPQSGKL